MPKSNNNYVGIFKREITPTISFSDLEAKYFHHINGGCNCCCCLWSKFFSTLHNTLSYFRCVFHVHKLYIQCTVLDAQCVWYVFMVNLTFPHTQTLPMLWKKYFDFPSTKCDENKKKYVIMRHLDEHLLLNVIIVGKVNFRCSNDSFVFADGFSTLQNIKSLALHDNNRVHV